MVTNPVDLEPNLIGGINPEMLDMLFELTFEDFDEERKGYLNKSQFKKFLTLTENEHQTAGVDAAEIDKLWKELDSNERGKVEKDRLKVFFRSLINGALKIGGNIQSVDNLNENKGILDEKTQ